MDYTLLATKHRLLTNNHELRIKICYVLKLLIAINLLFAQGGFAQSGSEVIKKLTLPCDTILHASMFPNIAEYKVKEPRIALTLSGGGAKGFAHIGVLRELEKQNVFVDAIYGTSIGAVVGGLYSIGYSTEDLINNFKLVDLGSLFSISEEVRREHLYQEQKISFSKSFITIRFKNFLPVIPSFITSGQELTNQINKFVLQGLYHTENFEELPIKFHAVSTDMITGRSIAMSKGNLSDAIRGSLTWPLLNPPVAINGYQLVDGGILANIPVHFPREDGYDIVIAVNATSGMKPMEDMNNISDVFDRLLSIMQLEFDERELSVADVVIAPDLQKYTATSFTDVDSLVALGQEATAKQADAIKRLKEEIQISYNIANGVYGYPIDGIEGVAIAVNDVVFDEIVYEIEELQGTVEKITDEQKNRNIYEQEIIETLKSIKRLGYFKNVSCEIMHNLSGYKLNYKLETYPFINSVNYFGNSVLSNEWMDSLFLSMRNKPFNHIKWGKTIERLSREYRQRNLSLAMIHTVTFDSVNHSLNVQITEGRINEIKVVGNDYTNELLILREFPLRAGNLFNIENATRGLANIFSTDLFESVSMDVETKNSRPNIFIKVVEKPSESLHLGLRVDNERYSQIYLDLRNDNFLRTGGSLGLTTQTGFRDFLISADYRMSRIFNTPFFSKLEFKYQFENQFQYKDENTRDDGTRRFNSWSSDKTAEFKELKYGGSLTLGTLYRKLGYLFAEYKIGYQEIKPLGADTLIEHIGNETISSLRFGLLFDSQDRYPFPQKGSYLSVYYEMSPSWLYTGVPYTKTFFNYEIYIPFSKLIVVHPKVIFGFGDNALPYTEQFKLGGQGSFFGLKENNYRGRQIFTGSIEYRYKVPIKFWFDTYLAARYDIGSVWEQTTALKLSGLRHGLGASLLVDTPIGPADFSVGQVFRLTRDLPNNPISFGPFYTYLSLGFDF